jgi:hypothetical protein
MKIILTGEDGFTYNLLTNSTHLKTIMDDLCVNEIIRIWFRPSFGRGAGAKKNDLEKGYSGFGEADAMLFCKNKSNHYEFIFIEAKRADIHKSDASLRELRYQFYLKLALVDAMHKAKNLTLGKSISKEHYCIDLNDDTHISKELYRYYKSYKGMSTDKNITRKNGWKILKHSPSSPALLDIEHELSENKNLIFRFYAIGYTKRESKKERRINVIENIADIPAHTKKLFNINENLEVIFRTIKVDGEKIETEIN